jgi:hypothetical protein
MYCYLLRAVLAIFFARPFVCQPSGATGHISCIYLLLSSSIMNPRFVVGLGGGVLARSVAESKVPQLPGHETREPPEGGPLPKPI